MVRSTRHLAVPIGAFTLAVALGLGMSAGPAFGDEPVPDTPLTQVQPTSTAPTPNTSTEPTTSPSTPTVAPTTSTPTDTPESTTRVVPSEVSALPTPSAPSPASSAVRAEDQLPDLHVSLAFDKPAYDARDMVGVRVTVVNAGSAAATEVKVVSWSGNLDIGWWEVLGVRLEPDERVEVTRTAFLRSLDADLTARLTIEVRSAEEEANLADNTATATAQVTLVRGTLRGVLYADRNMNAAMDPGEQLSNIEVQVTGGRPYDTYKQRTDAQGRFTFRDMPAGEYFASFAVDSGESNWRAEPQWVVVDGVDDPDIMVRAMPKIADALTITMAFTKNTYSVGEIAHLDVRLTNQSSVPIPRITANWYGYGTPNPGALAKDGPGVTVPERSTLTVDVTIPVTDEAFRYGHLSIWGGFQSPLAWSSVEASARAGVPGGIAPRVGGSLRRTVSTSLGPLGPPHSEPLPNTKVYLRNQLSGAVAARSVTAADGTWVFTNVPAGLYEFGVVGPWRMVWGPSPMQVYAGENNSSWDAFRMIIVAPGPEQPDPGPVPPTEAPQSQPPQPQPGVEPQPSTQAGTTGLAYTGANVLWMAIGGLLALAAGVGLVLRRGRTPRI